MSTKIGESFSGHRLVVCLLMAVTAACGASAEPEPLPGPGDIARSLTTTGATADGAGYVHLASRSKFRLGTNATNISQFGFSKVVGTEGVFATSAVNNWVLASPNADAPSTKVEPLTRSPDTHNQTVIDYFEGAGLPAAQVGNVTVHADIQASGDRSTAVHISNGSFAGYTSILTRVVAGIPVPDSFAWAQFNANGDVVREGVYWPPIPDMIIQQAQTLTNKLADPAQLSTYKSKLPAGLINGQVVIRHSACSDRSTFEAFAGYDLLDSREMGTVRHFDINGVEFLMKSEVPPGPQQPRKR